MGVEKGARRTPGATVRAERRWLKGRLALSERKDFAGSSPPRRPRPQGLNCAAVFADPTASPVGSSCRSSTDRNLHAPSDRGQTEPPALSCSPCGLVSPAPVRPALRPLHLLHVRNPRHADQRASVCDFPPLLPFCLVFSSVLVLFSYLVFVLYLLRLVSCNLNLHSSTPFPRPECPPRQPCVGWGPSGASAITRMTLPPGAPSPCRGCFC